MRFRMGFEPGSLRSEPAIYREDFFFFDERSKFISSRRHHR